MSLDNFQPWRDLPEGGPGPKAPSVFREGQGPMTFAEVIIGLKEGHTFSRGAWGGIQAESVQCISNGPVGGTHLVFTSAQIGQMGKWTAKSEDLLAEDWYCVRVSETGAPAKMSYPYGG